MFTGIITDIAPIKKAVKNKEGLTLTFARPKGWDDLFVGESVATDGVCLTVAKLRKDSYDCFLMPETLKKTSFGSNIPAAVNLERSMRANDRFGGHFVQGHVDATGKVTKIEKSDGYLLYVEFPVEHKALVIHKGSIAINGVSLTVAKLDGNKLAVALIPHTLEHTTLNALQPGDSVNLEFDMVGKYIVNASKP
jgi:riboflavin synthase